LEEALAGGEPLHIVDMAATAVANPRYEFLRDLIRRGLNDAVFLPVASQTSAPAVVAFATRASSQYDPAHMRFLNNLAQLITESFGRTYRLAERSRLASIGEFASGIAHEMRTPLATVSLALEYFMRQEQPPNARKRLHLASTEAQRMGRLIDDMLLYAKPLSLDLVPMDPAELLNEAIEMARSQPCCREREIRLESAPANRLCMLVQHDRMMQVLTNLLRNACEAAPPGTQVSVSLVQPDSSSGAIDIRNGGDVIPGAVLERAFQPFVSAKRGGTGLGLAIVHRLIQMHGGQVSVFSTVEDGTRARITLPLCGRGQVR
jgi:signal transduction histidine kinase